MKIIFNLVFLLCVLTPGSESRAQNSGSIDISELAGKTCVVSITEKIRANHIRIDNLTFTEDSFVSEMCKSEKMYSVYSGSFGSDNMIYFEAEFRSENNKKIKWSCEIKDNAVNGTLTYYVNNKIPVVNNIKGIIK